MDRIALEELVSETGSQDGQQKRCAYLQWKQHHQRSASRTSRTTYVWLAISRMDAIKRVSLFADAEVSKSQPWPMNLAAKPKRTDIDAVSSEGPCSNAIR